MLLTRLVPCQEPSLKPKFQEPASRGYEFIWKREKGGYGKQRQASGSGGLRKGGAVISSRCGLKRLNY